MFFAYPSARWAPAFSALALSAAATLPVQAQTEPSGPPTCPDTKARFMPYEPSAFTVQQPKGDEAAVRLNYSLRYRMVGCDRGPYGGYFSADNFEAFFSFSGEFDFYMGTRPSSPVINRIANPAVHLRKYLPQRGADAGQDWLDLSFEHLSNGQTTGVKSVTAASVAQAAYDAGNHRFFDTISRSSDFLALSMQRTQIGVFDRVQARVKLFRKQDSIITWGPLANQGHKLDDYDRLRLTVAKELGSKGGELAATWTVGDRGAKTDSWDLTWLASRDWPVFVRYHHGPMHNLSNYTQSVQYLGLGARFEP